MIEIDEGHLVVAQHIAEAAGRDEILDVAPVSRPLGDDDLRGSFALAQLDDGGDDVRIRVDDLVAMILDEVRLEDDTLAGQSGTRVAEMLVLTAHHVGEVGVVIADRRDVDERLRIEGSQLRQRVDGQSLKLGLDALAERTFAEPRP